MLAQSNRTPSSELACGCVVSDFVELMIGNRGWPWPSDSWGLTPMFGEDGWCHSCGTPRHAQSGPLILQRKGVESVEGAWAPYWQHDVICMDQSLTDAVTARFSVDVRPVEWPRTPAGAAFQIVVPTVGDAWFDHDELRVATIEAHGTAGATCVECGVWRWMPLAFMDRDGERQGRWLPPLRITPALGEVDIAASPEWFGDGMSSHRQVLVRRELAEMLAAASPRRCWVREVPWG